jgi:CRISPR/Cas system CSM-associated protein Csm3 (group 7 of RAMP superfamily)
MARVISARLRLQGTLVATTPLHVGGFGEDVDTDLPLARNGRGEWYVPGTSLAGALRQWCEQRFGKEFVRSLWGFQERDEGRASFVVIEDASIENAGSILDEIRDHVGIDRKWGCAAEHIKFDRAILPRGTRLRFCLTVEVASDADLNQVLAMLAHLKSALENQQIRLGAAKTRGLGRVKLENGQIRRFVFNTRDGLLALLENSQGQTIDVDELAKAQQSLPLNAPSSLSVTIEWEPVGPLMVKSGYEGVAADMVPLVSGINGQVALVLPGSSIKGALRSHAERIIRTLLDRDVSPRHRPNGNGNGSFDPKQWFLRDVEVPLITELFGERGKRVKDDKATWLPGLGALAVDDCFGTQHLSRDQWRAIESAQDDAAMCEALAKAGLETWQEAYHVAVDRWLGSAAESMLYTVLEPHRTAWEPIRLEINFYRLPQDRQPAAAALLLLVLRDLAQDRIPLGFATHRGMGTIRVTNVSFAINTLDGTLAKLAQVRLENGQLLNVPEEIKQAWQQWIRQARQGSQNQGATA